ncbi:DnaJ domain containing protein [Novymonas esmeraldas]|uniref:DnaJ domain containing protein n=1 Tax=Novymonas esmeraldas TaxID=1808958 RepID=A0AAW0ENM6_9TRYP
MFVIRWCVAHWKLVAAALLAILFFSYRTRPVSAKSQPQQEEEEEQGGRAATASEMKAPQSGAAELNCAAPGPAPPPQPPSSAPHAAPGAQDASSPPVESTASTAPAPGESLDPVFEEITGLFASRNPKHALQGLSDGLRNAATGVGLGLAGVVAGTYGGAKEGGWGGMAKGFGAGMAGFVGLTGYGAYTGVRQIVRGVGNTPSAVSEVSKGEAYWDSTTQAWVRVNLADDLEHLPPSDTDILGEARRAYEKAEKDGTLPTTPPSAAEAAGSDADATANSGATPSLGTETAAAEAEPVNYYVFLGVEATATPGEIRKAYTRRALEMHPDKNPNDPNATLKFQELNKIYNVLSHEDTRARYDRYGTVDPASVPEMAGNPMKDLLGAAFLDPLVGPLHFFLVFESGVLFTAEMQRELHTRRRLRVAKNLLSWLEGGASGLAAAQLALRDAVSTALGPVFVSYVAEQYHLAARQELHGSTWKREMDSWYSSWAMSASSLWHWTSMGARTARRAFVDKNLGEEDILRVLAVANERDVRHIALQACRLVLFDVSVPPEQRQQRARRLEELSALAMEEVARELTSRESQSAIAAAEAATAKDQTTASHTSSDTNGAASPPS